mmetsp:Transcript_44432/g.125768  ORF Transcript_44432/g.125768 Transcript_44432/m.125768 type:complete len:226 (-) Transcript_44432:75-752(-)
MAEEALQRFFHREENEGLAPLAAPRRRLALVSTVAAMAVLGLVGVGHSLDPRRPAAKLDGLRGVIAANAVREGKEEGGEPVALVTRSYTPKTDGIHTRNQLGVTEGETVFVKKQDEHGWYYITQHGKEGWVPNGVLRASTFIVTTDFTPAGKGGKKPQMAVKKGDYVICKEEKDHWYYAYKVDVKGHTMSVKEGWIPSRSLEESEKDSEMDAAVEADIIHDDSAR